MPKDLSIKKQLPYYKSLCKKYTMGVRNLEDLTKPDYNRPMKVLQFKTPLGGGGYLEATVSFTC